MSSVDSLYEYAGFKLAGILQSVFSGGGLPLIVALAGVAWVVQSIGDRGSIRDLGVYVCYLLLAAGFLASTDAEGVPAPRLLVYLNQAADVLQKKAVRRVDERFLTQPFEWERIAAQAAFGRVLDRGLERDLGEFLSGCARSALSRAEPSHPNLFREGALPYEGSCEGRRRLLWQRLQTHAQQDPHHRALIAAAQTLDPARGSAFAARYVDALAIRAIDEPGSPTSEASLVRASLGETSYTDPAQYTGAVPLWAKSLMGVVGLAFGDDIVNVALTGLAELSQNWTDRYLAKQKYYLATTLGPHAYGLTLMMLLGLFPAAGLFALLPGKWIALANYAKVFLSVKLWPVGWAALTAFNSRRSVLEAFDPPARGAGETFLVVSAMYLVTPALAYLVVHLAAGAAALPVQAMMPPAAGPGSGPAGPAASAAARLAR